MFYIFGLFGPLHALASECAVAIRCSHWLVLLSTLAGKAVAQRLRRTGLEGRRSAQDQKKRRCRDLRKKGFHVINPHGRFAHGTLLYRLSVAAMT